MINILLNGACGRMGAEVIRLAADKDGYNIAAKVDLYAQNADCFTDINDCTEAVDIIIDFSNHSATEKLLGYAVQKNLPVIIATTGQTDDELNMIRKAAEKIPVFHSANMSLGVALLVELAVKAAAVMPDADIEIVETHHNRKLDAPSGTALMLANALKAVREGSFLNIGRNGIAKRDKNEIGISSIRRGNIVGTHEVILCTDNQTIAIKHEAHSRSLFAEGALSAAAFLVGKPAGLYDMNSIVRQ